MAAATRPAEAARAIFHVVGRPPSGGPILVRTRHDLDLTTVPAARTELAALLVDTATPPSVLLHLGRERFVDIRGLRLLVDTSQQARARGGELAVVAAPRCLRSMVDRLDLGAELPLRAGE